MKQALVLIFSIFIFLVSSAAHVVAAEPDDSIPVKVPADHWSCREISSLAEKYGASTSFPVTGYVEKKELARSLLNVLDRVTAICEQSGPDAVSQEDKERLTTMYNLLKEDLALYEGYLQRRDAIEAILVSTEEPPFEYKIGLGGFARGEGTGNFTQKDYSYKPGRAEGQLLYRIKPYGYWHPTDYLDLHVEGQLYGFSGGNNEFNRFSLYQGFIEGRLPGYDWLAVKAGRQEFSYGSTFILGTDSFHDGLTFDSLRIRLKPISRLSLDLLGGYYARPFSNGIVGDLAGAYATWAFSEGNSLETYLFIDGGSPANHPDERQYTYGIRGTANLGPVALEIEPALQWGKLYNSAIDRNEAIKAFGGHVDAEVSVPLFKKNSKFYISYAYGSGSRGAAFGNSFAKEFRNPNNDTSLVGDANVVGDLSGINVNESHASGLQIYTAGWGIDITKEVNFSATGHYFVANYTPDGFSRHIGLETDFNLTYKINNDFSVILAYDRFFTGKFFRDAGGNGSDIDYGYMMFQFNLAKTKNKPGLAGKKN